MKKFTLVGLILSIFILTFSFSSSALHKPSNIRVVVNGELMSFIRQPVTINGRLLVPAQQYFEKLGGDVSWDANRNDLNLITSDTEIYMHIGSTYAGVNNRLHLMEAPPILINGAVMIPVRFIAEILNIDISWDGDSRIVYVGESTEPKPVSRGVTPGIHRVVIDPGHGGKDPGAIHGGITEKELNMDISRRLFTLLNREGIITYMTRHDDSYIPLRARSDMANRLNADLFVSIHNNAGLRNTHGSMTLYYPGSTNGMRFANIVQQELTRQLNTNNLGIIPRPNLVVLRTTNMPAVIAEIGYMTNTSELNRLKTPEFRQKAAEALRDAIVRYLSNSY